MTTPITDEKLPDLEALLAKATPRPWDVWREPCPDPEQAMQELVYQVLHSDPYAGELFLLNAGGKCPGTTVCGPTSAANAALVVFLRNHGDALLARIRSDQQERERLEGERDSLASEASHWTIVAEMAEERAQSAEARVRELEDGLQARRSIELRDLMREISEDHWCAGWMNGLERSLWAMVFGDASRRFGMGEIPAEQIERLRFLATETNTWWRWGDDGEVAITLADFRTLLNIGDHQ